MSKVMYITFLFVSLGLIFYIVFWNSPDKVRLSKATRIDEKIVNTVQTESEKSKINNEVRISILNHFDYLFKLRQELFLHWGFFITVTMAFYGFILMRDKNAVDLPKHTIAACYTIFTIVILFVFLKILRACNMCVEDLKFLYSDEIKKYPEDGLINSSINYNYMRTFYGCVVEIILFVIPTYIVIYRSKSSVKVKKK